MAHQFSFPDDFHATCNFVAAVKYVFQGYGDNVHVVICIYTSSYAEAEQVEAAESVFTGYGVSIGEDISDFAATHAGFEV